MNNHQLTDLKYITVNKGNETHLIRANKVLYIKAHNNYSLLVTIDNATYCSCKTLKQIEVELAGNSFFRAHRSYIVNLIHVKSLHSKAPYALFLNNGTKIPLARNKKKNLFVNISLNQEQVYLH